MDPTLQTSSNDQLPKSSSNQELNQLPREKFWEVIDIYRWEEFWCSSTEIERISAFQSHFQADDNDVIIASSLKTGTTWLKAVCVSIIHGDSDDEDLLIKGVPHAYAPNLENQIYQDSLHPDLSSAALGMPSPRLFHTHVPYNSLPHSIKKANCKIVYITRNPKDTLVSLWYFFNKIFRPRQDPLPFDTAFHSFCNGVHPYGPFFDHVLSYWTESLKMPHKILFLKYEDLKSNPIEEAKKLASFLGKPFHEDEDVQKVMQRCSLDRLKNLAVTKNGMTSKVPNSFFYRLGTVGDWKNYLTPEMSERLDHITRMKLQSSGLDLQN
ncbi:Flavonol 4'-sulfotransferase, putative [Ricinus communis]|uniref:Sulfotransferase n=1 Tax=Ricinus communis TaxID=3988 RepID=B9SKF3_RICCO|nr:Flavonol 4'-sulfotransferase, putative [Ricinus communis]